MEGCVYPMASRQYAVRVWISRIATIGDVKVAKRKTVEYLKDPLRHGGEFRNLKEQNLDAFKDSVTAYKKRMGKVSEEGKGKKVKDPRGRKPLLTAEQVCEAGLLVKGIARCGVTLTASMYRLLTGISCGGSKLCKRISRGQSVDPALAAVEGALWNHAS